MLKKWGKVIIVGIIIILFIGLIITVVSKEFKKIDFESPYDMKVEPGLSDSLITCISGKIDVSNPENNPTIDIVLPNCKGLLKFENEKFGEITFDFLQDEDYLSTEKTTILEAEENTYAIFLWLENSKIPKLWNTFFYNGEIGEITMDISIEINVMGFILNMEFPSKLNKVIDISITDMINDYISRISFDNTTQISPLLPRFNFSFVKESGSRNIVFSSLYFKLPIRKNLWLSNIEFPEKFHYKCSSEILTIFEQKFTVDARNLIFTILKNKEILPGKFEIYANDIKIGDITTNIDGVVEKGCFRNYFHSKKDCSVYVKIHDLMLDDCLRLHIKNENTTWIKIYQKVDGKINKNSPIISNCTTFDISTLFSKMIKKDQDQKETYTLKTLSDIEIWLIFIICILIILIIVDYIWEKNLLKTRK